MAHNALIPTATCNSLDESVRLESFNKRTWALTPTALSP